VLDISLCYARADGETAAVITRRIERGAEVRVWLEECDPARGETVAEAWEAGLSSAAILLLLSPDAVPGERTRSAWQSVLDHLEQHASPPLGSVLLRDCDYARLLERRHFFRWSDGATAVLRALASWLVELHPEGERPLFVPSRLPWFEGRGEELELLWNSLVDGSGTVALVNPAPGSGKTSLAQEFARAASGHFRDVLWVDCGGRSPAFLAGDLESQLGAGAERLEGDGFEKLASLVERHRILLVLDDVGDRAFLVAARQGHGSVLITTRSAALQAPEHVRVLALEGAGAPAPAAPPADPADERLWKAMAACRGNDLPLDLAAAIAGLGGDAARQACERLVAAGFVAPLDEAGRRFRLSASSRGAALDATDAGALSRAHATALNAAFLDTRSDAAQRRALVAELESGIEWALLHDWELAVGLSMRSARFLKTDGRLREAARVYDLLREAARRRGDAELAAECTWELSWLRDEPGEIRRVETAGQQLALDFR
jgi:hypothetical protein